MSSRTATIKELNLFNEHLRTLVGSDLAVPEGLRRAAREVGHAGFASLAGGVSERMERGMTLADALDDTTPAVPPLYSAMVRAGEASGSLVGTVDLLEGYYRTAAILDSRIRTALIYPALVLLAMALFLPLYSFTVAEFSGLFASMNVELPVITRFVLRDGPATAVTAGILIACSVVLLAASRDLREAVLGSLPLVGRMLAMSRTARVSRLLAMLLRAGLPLDEALDLTAGACGSAVATKALRSAAGVVRQGGPLSEGMGNGGGFSAFPLTFHWTVAAGERSGRLEGVLDDMAGYYEAEAEVSSHSVPIWIEAVLLIALGALVLMLVLAVFSPLVKIINNVG